MAVLTLEQFNTSQNASTTRPAQLAQLWATPSPPTACRAFYVTSSAKNRPAVISTVDAMLISETTGLPTINGYSGQVPPGYGAVADPSSPKYLTAVAHWAKANGINSGLCAYNESKRSWTVDRG